MGGWLNGCFKYCVPFSIQVSEWDISKKFIFKIKGGLVYSAAVLYAADNSQNLKNLTSDDVMPNPIQIPIDVEM